MSILGTRENIRHNELCVELKEIKPRVLFLGDSITDQWRKTGDTVWKTSFEHFPAAEAGIGGDTTAGLLWRIKNGILSDISPKVIVILIGTNDALHISPCKIAENIKEITKYAKQIVPGVKIILMSLLPRERFQDSYGRRATSYVNAEIQVVAENEKIDFVDNYKSLLNKNNEYTEDLSIDGIHLTEKGYVVLGEAIAPIIERNLNSLNSSGIKDINGSADFELVEEASEYLWVIISPRGMAEGKFAYFREGNKLKGNKLFLKTKKEDFYQCSFEGIFKLIEEITDTLSVKKIIYVGFSAGAYAALVLGLRSTNTHRILAFAPQFRLDHPLTIAYRTLKPINDSGFLYDSRFSDILQDLNQTKTQTDIFLGVYDVSDGIMVHESLAIKNTQISNHYVKWNHDVAAEISRSGALPSIMSAAISGNRVTLPKSILASESEVHLAGRMYFLAKALEYDKEKVNVPDFDDSNNQNPAWWNLKSRIRHKKGDVVSAIGDVVRAISIDGKSDGNFVCLGHYLRDINQFSLAEASYKIAISLNEKSWTGSYGLANLYVSENRFPDALLALELAKQRGLPENEYEFIKKTISA